ncbi:putative pex2 pex12 amino terminal region protein [Phialemonium atrogriseum]|uniref:Peroxisome assembly protein 12 n=1 Tax=Phialemonium atrogriseum TaxID=1093897 RepID=A0AAJ0C741_9PEZI|nr:putative pex2 pex12 amino terminal region protein [Phialemonium atrogriseum]KAK1771365.1 putative pex2 pex12 amino terminal region protein [Phialemonium atrogriseum]
MEFVTALRASSFDEAKPSLFELLSEAQLSALLPPTLRYLLTVATQRYPRHLLRMLNSFDELYALLALLVERHYLRTRGGSFTEHFYGLRRELAVAGGGGSGGGKARAGGIPRASVGAPDAAREALRLRGGDLWRNLAVAVVVPYLKRKLDEAYEVNAPRRLLGSAYNRLPAGASLRERLLFCYRWFLTHAYPGVNAAYHLSALAFGLAYLFDRSTYHNPFMWLVGTRLRRMNASDYQAIEALGKTAAAAAAGSSALSPRNVGARVLGGLSVLLPTSIFALKFLEWWHASDFARQLSRRAAEGLDLPTPIVTGLPEAARVGREEKGAGAAAGREDDARLAETAPVATPSLLPVYTVAPAADSELCPICEGEIVTATACQTGFVYCYSCIHKWIAGEHPKQEDFMQDKEGKWESGAGRCAVTGRRVLGGTEGLRRIMV